MKQNIKSSEFRRPIIGGEPSKMLILVFSSVSSRIQEGQGGKFRKRGTFARSSEKGALFYDVFIKGAF